MTDEIEDTIEQRKVRESVTQEVLRRDNFECQVHMMQVWLAVEWRGRLDPHHVAPVSRFPELRHDKANLLTVCRAHHDAIHGHPERARSLELLA